MLGLPKLLSDFTKVRRGLVLALRSLWLHKLRSFLSVLGIIIGTGAVIALMAFGEGSMQETLDDIRRQGATNIIVRSVKPPEDGSSGRRVRVAQYGLTQEDYEAFEMDAVLRRVPMRSFSERVRRPGVYKYVNGRVVGTTPEYGSVHQMQLSVGRFLVADDDFTRRDVCVLGSGVADSLFPFDDPLGKNVVLRGQDYTIVGVVRERAAVGGATGGTGGGTAAEDFNNDVYIPLETVRSRFGATIYTFTAGSSSGEQVELSQVTLTAPDTDKVRPLGELVRQILESRHVKRDWSVFVPLDRLEEAERAKTRFTRLLVVIAGISLVVGGIGIMNIMLATVTERTREIGIRRALGAKRRDITLQFLIEAVVQTSLGGLLGVIMGLGAVLVLPLLSQLLGFGPLPAQVQAWPVVVSVGVSIVVGVLFGWYPARSAARLDPIEALRHD